MMIAELFVNLGVKGAEKATSAVAGVSKALNEVKSSGLAAKAAVVAAVYALERLTIGAAEHGTSLQLLAEYTGKSTDDLQRWQVAGINAGLTADQMADSFKSIGDQMAAMKLGLGAPMGAQMLAAVGVDDFSKLDDQMYALKKIMELARSPLGQTPEGNIFLKSMIPDEAVLARMKAGRIELEKAKASSFLSAGEIAQLDRINIQWKKFGYELNLVRDRLVANFGIEGIKDLRNSFKFISDMAVNVKKLADEFPALKTAAMVAGVAIAAAFFPITTTIAEIIYLLSEVEKYREGKQSLFSEGNWFDKKVNDLMGIENPKEEGGVLGAMVNRAKALFSGEAMDKYNKEQAQKALTPPGSGPLKNEVYQNQYNTTNIHTDTSNPKEHGDTVNKMIKPFYQFNSALQGN